MGEWKRKGNHKTESMTSIVHNMDCMELMQQYPDKYFDLAVVDPPYAVGAADGTFGNRRYDSKTSKLKAYANADKVPDLDYFSHLFRISKNWVVWGANYYPQYFNHTGAIIWHKKTCGPLSDCEIAFQSFDKKVKYYWHEWFGFKKGTEKGMDRMHPNQKPVALYDWIYKNYLPKGGKVIDTHLGSGSNRIAADKAGNIDFVAAELDKDYFEAQEKRWREYKAQLKLW